MISLAARLLLLFESSAYLVVGSYLYWGLSFSLGQIALMLIGIALLVRGMLTLPGCVVATGLRLVEGFPVGITDTLVALARETVARAISYTAVQPFEKWLMNEETPTTPVPVLLLHGYVCNRGVWLKMRAMLRGRVPNSFCTLNMEPPFARIDDYVPQVANRIEAICAASGAAKVIIIAHSMGGIIARAYLSRAGGTRRVAKLITLCSPHHGTRMAMFGLGKNVRQMYYENDWLASLAGDEHTITTVPVTSIYTENDDLVFPPESSRLPNARNIPLRAIGHVSALFSRRVADIIADEIRVYEAMPADAKKYAGSHSPSD